MRNRSVSRWRPRLAPLILAAFAVGLIAANTVRLTGQASTTGWKLVAWNNLGMHCMDADFSVFAILPPYNTIQAQLIDPSGKLVPAPAGSSVTYEAVADPTGSINKTSAGKTNFWTFVNALFGASLGVDTGLLNHNMPGSRNLPQPMAFDPAFNWYIAEGIPITPYDDAGKKNYYPLMRVSVTDANNTPLASTKIVLPVSDEMDCRACHASGSGPAARPSAGWVNVSDAQRDYRLNILLLHDDRQFGSADAAKLSTYQAALKARGYSPAGLYATATGTGTATVPAAAPKAILCANCHRSEALAGSGFTNIPPLTASIHSKHAAVVDPTNGLSLDSTANRSACYRCHPGSETRCLRGTMGNAVAPDGSMAIQCQNCHGKMSAVGAPTRTGWLDEPSCQNCHSGTAAQNAGQIRYVSAFDASGQPRTPANATFATQDATLYRFSAGHGGLQCSACHGSTHAEYPSSHPNDNLQSVALQGHVGTVSECSTCHGQSLPLITTAGPHGMHPVGSSWVTSHHDAPNKSACQACHGTDYRGTVLSRAFGDRTMNTAFGTKSLFRGEEIGCYMCHNGPSSSSPNPDRAPVAAAVSVSTPAGVSVAVPLSATDADGDALTLRIVSQPANGTVGLAGTTWKYFPNAGFSGTDTFTYTARDGSVDSKLATGTVTVVAVAPCTITTAATVPTTGMAGVAVQFSGSASASNCSSGVTYDWNFGDGSHASTASATHAYAAGTFGWTFTATAGGVTSVRTGSIAIAAVPAPSIVEVKALYQPFRIQIDGADFRQGVKVLINGTAWSRTKLVSGGQLLLSGGGLSSLFPSGVAVGIQVVNPDGQSASTTFTRR